MARLYLVRRSLENFLGPMTLEELIRAYERMDFGLQDEVAGHCGKWVSFDDLEELSKHYSELAQMVRENMLGGWGLSEHTATKLIKTKKNKKQKKKGFLGFFAILIAFGSVAAAAAFFLANNNKFSSQMFGIPAEHDLQIAQNHISAHDLTGFQSHMDQILPDVIERVKRSRRSYHDWIKYLRVYAFLNDGVIADLPPKLLRGMGRIYAPQDCSYEWWLSRWQTAERQWTQLFQNPSHLQQQWARILTWDPHWISRRQTNADWIIPGSFYEGCLMMASKAFDHHLSDTGLTDDQTGIKARLEFILATIRGQTVTHELNGDQNLVTLSCLDRGRSESEILRCVDGKEFSSEWQDIIERRRRLNQLRVLLEDSQRHLSHQGLTAIAELSGKIPAQDSVSLFDYQPELRFFRSLLRNSGNVRDAKRQTSYDFPDVDFMPQRP